MNSILTRDPALGDFAARLLQEPYFRDGTLTLYSDVPVPCIHYAPAYHICCSNPCSDKERYRHRRIGLLVCQESAVLLAVCFDEGPPQHEAMFATYLHGMDHLRCSWIRHTDTDLTALYQQATERLGLYTGYQLTSADYTLTPVSIPETVQALRQKYFLRNEAMSLFYTQDCGLFFQCTLAETGALIQTPVTSQVMSEVFFAALHWQSRQKSDADELLSALDTPVSALFYSHGAPELLTHNLTAAKQLMAFDKDKAPSTYADCLRILRRIDTVIKAPGTAPADADTLGHRRAAIVYALSMLPSGGNQFLRMPLKQYFEGCAALTGCYYPIWLYQQKVRPHLCNRPEEAFSLSDLLYTCQPHILFSSRAAAVVPALSTILTAPIGFADGTGQT